MLRFGFGMIAAGLLLVGLVVGPVDGPVGAPVGGTPDERLPGASVSATPAELASGCGSVYTIRSGDTLSQIAERVYGKSARYPEIFDANRDRLQDPARIRVGETIVLPCLDPVETATQGGAAEPALVAAIEAQLAEPTGAIAGAFPIRLLTASGLAPFADVGLGAGGMIPDLVTRALVLGSARPETRITFLDDWPDHQASLLPTGDFDLSFPWFKPDCAAVSAPEAELRLCTDFAFSDPLYQVTIGHYARAGDRLTGAVVPAELAGKRLCRADGALPPGLGTAAVVPGVILQTAPVLEDCLLRLHRGQADAVIALKTEADRQIRDLGLDAGIRAIPALQSERTLHALVLVSDPDGLADLAALDRGLASLKASGEWFRVVSTHNARENRP